MIRLFWISMYPPVTERVADVADWRAGMLGCRRRPIPKVPQRPRDVPRLASSRLLYDVIGGRL